MRKRGTTIQVTVMVKINPASILLGLAAVLAILI